MPRERIQHGKLWVIETQNTTEAVDAHDNPVGITATAMREYVPGEVLDASERLEEHQSLDVAWNRDAGWVQVSISAPREWFKWLIEDYKGKDPVTSTYTITTDVMTRTEINRLIATLRRARDAAYGKDE